MTSLIRRADLSDFLPLRAAFVAAYRQYVGVIEGLPDVSGGLDADIQNNDVWICLENDVVAGGIVLEHDSDVTLVANIAVHPDFGGRGFGRLLMAQAEICAQQRASRILRLSTHEDMHKNVDYYQQLGWQVLSHDPPKIVMQKDLKV